MVRLHVFLSVFVLNVRALTHVSIPAHAHLHLTTLRLLERETDPSLLQNASWTLSNLCRGKDPRPPQHLIFPALHMLYLLTHNRNEEILIGGGPSKPSFSCSRTTRLSQPPMPTVRFVLAVLADACWALSYISEGSNERIKKVIEAGVCGRLVELLL